MRFWVVFRYERAVSTIFPPYIMPNGTYERIKKISDTLPLREVSKMVSFLINVDRRKWLKLNFDMALFVAKIRIPCCEPNKMAYLR